MKTIRIPEPGKVEIIETEMPVRKKGEALLKLLYGGICGSDLGTYRGTFAYASYPRIPGHEFSAQHNSFSSSCQYYISNYLFCDLFSSFFTFLVLVFCYICPKIFLILYTF